jgi:hypothetical protein
VPNDQDELKRIFRVVASELSIAQVDQGLLLAVAKNIAKTVHLVITDRTNRKF